jgi:hypothetical protein
VNGARAALIFAVVLDLVILGYFALLAVSPRPISRVLMSRGYESQGWTEDRLAKRVRVLASVGAAIAVVALVGIVWRLIG